MFQQLSSLEYSYMLLSLGCQCKNWRTDSKEAKTQLQCLYNIFRCLFSYWYEYLKYSVFHWLLDAFVSEPMYSTYIRLPTENSPLADEIATNPKLFPFLKDCLGAIDGTHIPPHVPASVHPCYWNRKGEVSQNVLAACTFDMCFCYVLSGWEGSAADSAIFDNARGEDFLIPKTKFYLGDAGFPCCDTLLVPYHGVQYHLQEWGLVRER